MRPTEADHLEQIARHSFSAAADLAAAVDLLEQIRNRLRDEAEHHRPAAEYMPGLTWCAWVALVLLAVIAFR